MTTGSGHYMQDHSALPLPTHLTFHFDRLTILLHLFTIVSTQASSFTVSLHQQHPGEEESDVMSLEPTLSIVTSILLTDVLSLTAASTAFRVSSSSTSWYTCRSAQGKVRDTHAYTGTACVQLQVYAGR